MNERIVWTALPNGFADGALRLSVFIAPQLDPTPGPPRLGAFPRWLDWPATVAGLRFRVSFQSGAGEPLVLEAKRDPASSVADSSLWRKFFGPDTPLAVFGHKPLHERIIRSYPAANIVSFLEKPYRACAVESPTRLPPIHILADPETGFGKIVRPSVLRKLATFDLGTSSAQKRGAQRSGTRSAKQRTTARVADPEAQVRLINNLRQEVTRDLVPRFAGRKFIVAGPVDPAGDFLQAKLFQLPRITKRLPKRISIPDMDFHRMLSTLGQHPEMLRRAGLVVDLVIPLEGAGPLGEGQAWISLDAPPAGATSEFPRTEFEFDPSLGGAAAFAARPSPTGETKNRLLGLGDGRFQVVQMDVDGAAQKAIQLADNIHRSMSPRLRTTSSAETVSMPSLRSAGISVVRTGRAEILHRSFVRARVHRQAMKVSTPVSLFADDLTRGYRVDVFDGSSRDGGGVAGGGGNGATSASGRWRSLCARVATYNLTDGSPPIVVEGGEGWTATASTESATSEGSKNPDIYIQESLFRWAGWSLVTPRPGKHLDENQQAARARHQPGTGLPLTVETRAAPGTLPKLRFGASYRVRARAVDLAGNSLSVEEADRLPDNIESRTATPAVTYRRHEVVTQPVLRMRRTLEQSGPGEGMERLVIRSYNKGEVQPTQQVAAAELTGDQNERHLAPPGVGQLTAEAHGMFDRPGGLDAAAYRAIVDRDGEFQSDVYPQARLTVPYLPDPPARGAAFVGLPQAGPPDNTVLVFRADGSTRRWDIQPTPKTPISVVQVEFGPTPWPAREPFRLKSVATQTPRDPQWDADERVLTVFVPPGETVPVRYSTFVAREDLAPMATWQWIVEAGQASRLEGRALAGLHWMLTPYRQFTLVHAVQRPLIKPEFQKLASHRIEGQTSADLADQIPLSGKSTARLDVEARWQEPLDDGEEPRRVERGGHAFDMTIEGTDTVATFGPQRRLTMLPVRQIMRHKDLAKAAEKIGATPQAVRALKPQTAGQQADIRRRQNIPLATGRIGRLRQAKPEFRRLPAQALSRAEAEVEARTRTLGRHEFGDTKHRRVTYTAVASSRFRDDLPFTAEEVSQAEAENGGKRQTRRSEPVTIEVLSAARPAAPAVAYVVPTFGWESTESGDKRTSSRLGGGLRVYLERPWFSSGEGELLGVVINPPSRRLRLPDVGRNTASRDELRSYVTQWGMDPIWLTSPPGGSRSPALTSFRNALTTESGLSLAELPNAQVSVAGFPVGASSEDSDFSGYDPERKLWYADIEVDPGESYFPFIRLALTRYQPHSLAWTGGDLKLSRVVITDFAQLAPDRAATVSHVSETEVRVTVLGVTARQSGEEKFGAVASIRPSGPSVGIARPAPGSSTRAILPRTATPTATRVRVGAAQPPQGLRQSLVAGPLARVFGTSKTGGNSVEVSLETLPTGAGEELGWTHVAGATVELEPAPSMGASSVWRGTMTLPEPRGSRRFRLVIKEYEWFIADGEDVRKGDQIRKAVAPRLVYADALEI